MRGANTALAALLAVSTAAIAAEIAVADRLPGPGTSLGATLAMFQLGLLAGASGAAALSRAPRPGRELAGALLVGMTALLHTGLYAATGARNPLVHALEQALVAIALSAAVALLIRGFRGGRRAACRAPAAAVLAIFLLQIPLHAILAAPAARAAYDAPAALLERFERGETPAEIGLERLDTRPAGIRAPAEAAAAAARIGREAPGERYAWAMQNPLPNLPDAAIVVARESGAVSGGAWVSPPRLIAGPAIPWLEWHLLATSLSVLALAAPAFLLRYRGARPPA